MSIDATAQPRHFADYPEALDLFCAGLLCNDAVLHENEGMVSWWRTQLFGFPEQLRQLFGFSKQFNPKITFQIARA